jgi:hypothetical protein
VLASESRAIPRTGGGPPPANGLRRLLDFLSDWTVGAFAVWTVIAYAGMATRAPVSVLTPIWLGTTPLVALALALLRIGRAGSPEVLNGPPPREDRGWRGRRAVAVVGVAAALRVVGRQRSSPEPSDAARPETSGVFSRWRAWLVGIGVVSGVAAGILAAAASHVRWPFASLPSLIAVGCVVAAGGFRSRAVASPAPEPVARFGDLVAFGTALGFAVLALVVHQGSADDVFYVNRATAVDQLDRIPVLDVIFTHEEAPRGGGAGLPVDSYSALQGALAHVLGVQAPSVAYCVVPPLFTFLAIWSLWRLLRAWAPQRVLLCFTLGSIFWLFSAQAQLSSGSYFLTRIWQGKVAFVVWLVPTIYVYLTRWLEGRDLVTAGLLVAAGISAIGMTGSATFAAPLVFLTALIALVACADWRGLPAPLVAGGIPLVIGLAVLARFPLSETVGTGPMPGNAWFYRQLFGFGFVCAVAGSAVWLAPWLARPGPPARLASGIAVITAVLLTPGVLGLLHDVSGLTETLRRTLWLIPIPTVVGLLASTPTPRRLGRLAPVAVTAVVVCLLVALGHPLWRSRAGGSIWDFPPAWKVRKPLMATARAILAHYDGSGPILVRKGIMQEIAIVTAEPKAVNARSLYLIRTREPQRLTNERLTLTAFVMKADSSPSDNAVREALADLRVGLVCLEEEDPELIARLEAIAPAYQKSFETHGYACFERRPHATG